MTVTTDVVVLELPHVLGAVGPGEFALAMLLSIGVLAFILALIGPGFEADAVLHIVHPLTLVHSTIHTSE